MDVAPPGRPGTPSTLAARRLRLPGHHGMEEVRGSSPLSSTHYFPWSGTKRIGVVSAICSVLTCRMSRNAGLTGAALHDSATVPEFGSKLMCVPG